MSCTSPKTVTYTSDGKIDFRLKAYSRETVPFLLPCGKCLACRLDYAKQWAIRCVHEAKMHEKNSFITLTYSNEHLKSTKLVYADWQNFMKKLRKTQDGPIGCFVTGEYGDENKRPHWHALLFNYDFPDKKYYRTTEGGNGVYTSATLERLWGFNDSEERPNEIGDVNILTAGYCARYAAKKLAHDKEFNEEFKPISKKSSKYAIGRKWLERYYQTDCFNSGRLTLADGSTSSIPRYYERWLKQKHPIEWERYVTGKKLELTTAAQMRADKNKEEWLRNFHERRDKGDERPLTQLEIKKEIQKDAQKAFLNKLKPFKL